MSWLFSRALVEASSEAISWAGELSAPLNVMPTQHKFWRYDKTIEPSDLSRFGQTCELLMETRGEALLMWCLADSLVRTSAPQAKVVGSMESDPASGGKWLALWAKFDLDTSSWKTAQSSLLAGSESFSATWPRSGLMLHGKCYPLPNLGLRTSENASGLWPTPTASLGTKGGRVTPRKSRHGGTLIEAVSAAWWPTPHGFSPNGKSNGPSGNELGRAVNRSIYPTPRASGTTMGGGSNARASAKARGDLVLGSLNPTWVEWLMGWPLAWTDLKPLETDKFQQWLRLHSQCSPESLTKARA